MKSYIERASQQLGTRTWFSQKFTRHFRKFVPNYQENNISPKDLDLIDGDEDRLQQILYNLVSNAIKFSEKGKVEIFLKEANDKEIASQN